MSILEASQKRYTAKKYDANKKISDTQIKQLFTILRNSPSSVNSQPWHFFVISSADAKQKILPAILPFNHDRIIDASHVVIFCAKNELSDAYLQLLLKQEEQDGRFPSDEVKKATDDGRRHFVKLNSNTPDEQMTWKSKQVYIALGNLLLASASLGIDSTPIEGFDTQKMNEVLGLQTKGLSSLVIASLGYHRDDDYNSKLPKSRLPEQEIFTFL